MNDADSRQLIVDKLDSNIFVDASAGAGKTASLTRRMVALVEKGIPVNEICTITFTKNAANEFFERFQSLLADRCSDNPTKDLLLKEPTPKTKELCKKALNDINLCFMGTIDSFTNMIISEHPSEAHVPFGAKVSDQEDIDNAIKLFYYDVLKGTFDNEYPSFKNDLLEFNYYHKKPLEVFVTSMNKYINHSYLDFINDKKTNLEQIDIDRIIDFAISLYKIMSGNELMLSNDETRKFYDFLKLNHKKLVLIKKEYKNKDIFLINDLLKVICDYKIKISNVQNIYDFNTLIDNFIKGTQSYTIIDDYIDYKNRLNEYVIYKSIDLFIRLTPVLSKYLVSNGIYSFNDYLITVRDMLKEDYFNNGTLIKHVQTRHKYYLIDESQDTNPIQTEIFFYLTATKFKELEWKNTSPNQGSLFIVGDPKQSIYRFRDADVNSYEHTKEIFNKYGFEVVTLSKNFRSTNILKNYFNSEMKQVGIKGFEYIEIDDTDKTKKENDPKLLGAHYYTSKGKSGKGINPLELDPDVVSNIINTIVDNDDYLILPQKDKDLRKIRYSDIMVITRNKTSMNKYIDAFKIHDIPYIAEGKILFDSSELLDAVKTLFYFIVKPNNINYLYRALQLKIFNLSPKDYINIGKLKKFDEMLEDTNIKDSIIYQKLLILKEFVSETINYSYPAIFEYLLMNKELLRYYDTNSLDLCIYVKELISNAFDSNKIVNDDDAIEFVESIKTDELKYERSLQLNTKKDSIKIANVHKVKGLQAPVVILANTSISTHKEDAYVKYDYDKNKFTYEIFKVGDYLVDESKSSYIESVNESIEEAKRIDYVAATRAESALFIGFTIVDKGNRVGSCAWKNLVRDTHVPTWNANIKPLNDKQFTLINIDNVLDNPSSIINNKLDNNSIYKIDKPSAIDSAILSYNHNEEDNIVNDKALLGTLIHKLMELLIVSKNNYSFNNILKVIHDEYNVDIYDARLEKVYNTILNGGYNQSNNIDKDILNTLLSSEEVLCEVPFTYNDNNTISNGIMDVVYKKDNKWHIIDYKSNYEDDNDVLEEHYKKQLDIYKKAFTNITNNDCDAHIYHIEA